MQQQVNTHLQAHLQLFLSERKVFYGCKRACKFPAPTKLFFKISFPSKIFKTQPHSPRQTSMTATLHRDSFSLVDNLQLDTKDRTAGHNKGLAKVAVQWLIEQLCFVSSAVLVDSFVLRIRHLRQAPNRYGQVYKNTLQTKALLRIFSFGILSNYYTFKVYISKLSPFL
jgi:hypothetical protein